MLARRIHSKFQTTEISFKFLTPTRQNYKIHQPTLPLTQQLPFQNLLIPLFNKPSPIFIDKGQHHFHTSQIHTALPLALLLRPVLKVAAVLTGRTVRTWWRKLSPEQKAHYTKRFRDYRHVFYGICTLFFGSCGVYVAMHIENTPITGRRRFVAVDDETLDFLVNSEIAQIKADNVERFFPSSHVYTRRVKWIIQCLLKANKELAELHDTWTVHVIKDDNMVNAMCLPTGDVFVYSGLMKFVENNDQLAFVLAHEMAHVLLQHSRELVSFGTIMEWFLLVCITAIWAILPNDFFAFISHSVHKEMMNIIMKLPFNRKLEKEADEVGLEILAKACYDVRSGTRFWELMDAYEEARGIKVPEWLNTHPLSIQRAANIQELTPRAMEIRRECNCPPLLQSYDTSSNPFVIIRQVSRKLFLPAAPKE